MKKSHHQNLITHNIRLQKHEYDTIVILLKYGHHIELIPPSKIPGDHKADIFLDGVEWELKSPTSHKRSGLEQIIERAAKQSSNAIIDLRRIKIPEHKAIQTILGIAKAKRSIKRFKFVTKKGEILNCSP